MFTLTGFADEISSDLSLQLEGLKELGIRHLELRGVWHWEDYLGPLIYLNSVSNYTVPLALRMFMDTQSAVQWGQLLAMSLVSIVPQVLLFLAAQKHFVEGIATTGLKG